MTTYKLPPAFLDDHIDRDLLPESAVVRRRKTFTEVTLTDEQRAELLSDAQHYANPDNGYGRDFPGLCQSARATVRRLT